MSSFRCNICQADCCTCNGCQPMTSPKGTQCCNRCYQGVCRTESGADLQIQQIREQQNRPNERLYINNVNARL